MIGATLGSWLGWAGQQRPIIIKRGVRLEAVDFWLWLRILRAHLMLFMRTGQGLRVTSGRDGRHRPGSAHYRGQALDVTPARRDDGWDARKREIVIATLRENGLRVVDEYSRPSARSTGGHLHVELR